MDNIKLLLCSNKENPRIDSWIFFVYVNHGITVHISSLWKRYNLRLMIYACGRTTGLPPVAALAAEQSIGLFGPTDKLLSQFSPYFKSHHPYNAKTPPKKGGVLAWCGRCRSLIKLLIRVFRAKPEDCGRDLNPRVSRHRNLMVTLLATAHACHLRRALQWLMRACWLKLSSARWAIFLWNALLRGGCYSSSISESSGIFSCDFCAL